MCNNFANTANDGTVPTDCGCLEKRKTSMANSIQNIQSANTDALQKVGNPVGKDGKYPVQEAFTTFKDDLKNRSSENALNNLQKLSYRHTTLDTSGVEKFFLSLGQKILDICHNIRVALDSQQPALNIGVPIENLRNELLRQSNTDAIKNEFEQHRNDKAATYLRTVRKSLTDLQNAIDGKLKNNQYPDDTKAVLQGIQRYIEEIIIILAPTKAEQMIQFGHELKNDVKNSLQKVGNFFKSVGEKIYEKLPEDKEVEEELDKFAEKTEEGIEKLTEEIKQTGKKIKKLFDS